MLLLLLGQREDCSIEQRVEGVIVKLADWHELSFILIFTLDQLLKMLKHDSRLARIHRLLVLVLFPLKLLLLLSVELDFALEVFTSLFVFIIETNLHLLKHGALAHSGDESLSADISPQLLRVRRLLNFKLI